MPGHPQETLEVFNPTDREIAARIRSVRTGEAFDMTVPARGMLVR